MQAVPTYLGDCCIHNFDWQKVFKAKYMGQNFWASQVYRRYDEINMEQKSVLSM